MFALSLCACAVLAAAAPIASAQPSVGSRPDAVYQAFADKVTDSIVAKGCVGPEAGRVLPAIWLRFTFHDSGELTDQSKGETLLVTLGRLTRPPLPYPASWFENTGSFGFDGIIINEFDRPGNEGLALADMAHGFFSGSLGSDKAGTSIFMKDTMNLAATATTNACGGPQVPFLSGLSQPGPDPTGLLPLPSDSNSVTVANMERMSFTPEQIVAIVTGFHTMGGVHAASNPHLTTEAFASFDSTPGVFDKDFFKKTLKGECTIPFDCFLAKNEQYKSFVERASGHLPDSTTDNRLPFTFSFASDQEAFSEATSMRTASWQPSTSTLAPPSHTILTSPPMATSFPRDRAAGCNMSQVQLQVLSGMSIPATTYAAYIDNFNLDPDRPIAEATCMTMKAALPID
ncbi:heme peroxidase [Blyttiomyces helicus]|uniref:Peroxidase n=1 Tax=Blyttiomyces helicus TaxID=388810 RepID=A0A4P9WCN8_9FUNG|nr:heme peroxidase [Blyttiomyces helicus]|eukprot:RKO89425.1 heme peroxidase [Blyttiomyces helicus]